jgi:hypothetical protein
MRPVTTEQWQDAVDAAELLSRVTTAEILLLLELGRLFGLVDDNLEVDMQLCLDTLEEGREKSIAPNISVFCPKV